MLEEVKTDLGSNYIETSDTLLQQIIDDTTTNALFLSNRANNETNILLLSQEIKECVKKLYLLRGSEDTTSKNDSGISSNYQDALDNLRNNIIKNGKRLMK